MTMMFEVFLDARDGNRLAGSVFARNDGGIDRRHLPEFGLQLLMDSRRATGPLSPELEAEFDALLELFLGRKVRVDADGYLLEEGMPRVRASEFYQGNLSGSSGYDGENRYVVLKPEPAEFSRRTADIIVSFELTDDEDWPDADFELEVSDERYLAHLTTRTSFETAFTGCLPL